MRRHLSILLIAALLAGCGGARDPEDYNPVIRDQDRAMGAQQHPALLAEFGGAYDAPEARYVARIGEKVADAAELGGQCTFTLVNTDVVNAFAVPGCFIYVTRGLLGIVNSEAELASVLGHEVGHIVADHSRRQQQRSLLTGLSALAVGLLTGSDRLAAFAGRTAELFGLRYSRAQEFESDTLGIHYTRLAGYDPYEAAGMLEALTRNEALMARTRGDDSKRIPGWARTHPLTEERIERATGEAADSGVADNALPEAAAPFLAEIDGMLYGDDPIQGYVQGRRFLHPDMRIAFEAPAGFSLTNTPRAVLIQGRDGSQGQFGGSTLPPGGLGDYAALLLREVIGQGGGGGRVQGVAQRTSIGGVPAVLLTAPVQGPEGAADISVAAYAGRPGFGYHFVTVTPPTAEGRAARDALFASFRPLSPAQAATLRPRRIEVVAARPGDTPQSLAARMAVPELPLETFLALNGRAAAQPIRAGEPIKLVRYAG